MYIKLNSGIKINERVYNIDIFSDALHYMEDLLENIFFSWRHWKKDESHVLLPLLHCCSLRGDPNVSDVTSSLSENQP